MTDTQIFEPEGRAIPFVDEGDGPVKLVLIQEQGLAAAFWASPRTTSPRRRASTYCGSGTGRSPRRRSTSASRTPSP